SVGDGGGGGERVPDSSGGEQGFERFFPESGSECAGLPLPAGVGDQLGRDRSETRPETGSGTNSKFHFFFWPGSRIRENSHCLTSLGSAFTGILGKRRICWPVLLAGSWSVGAAGFGSVAPERATGRMPAILFARFTTPVMRWRRGSWVV